MFSPASANELMLNLIYNVQSIVQDWTNINPASHLPSNSLDPLASRCSATSFPLRSSRTNTTLALSRALVCSTVLRAAESTEKA